MVSPRTTTPEHSANQYVALMALKWRHAGQACITANRVYVQKGVYDKFADILKQRTSKLVVGHGAEKGTTMGPVTTPRSLDKALNQVEDAKKHGGQVILGGGKVVGKSGYFFEPTIILGAKKEMLITSEETFAPVLALYSFDTEDEAVTAANNTSVSAIDLSWSFC
jgi:succinate-semialdehyde dehydrogenase/glutarate-semialdehyde dehydrogenase